jgi:hypothetical protein
MIMHYYKFDENSAWFMNVSSYKLLMISTAASGACPKFGGAVELERNKQMLLAQLKSR